MKDFKNKVAVITGAGSGMGRELAIELASSGASIALVEVNEETLNETAELLKKYNVGVSKHIVDVSDKQAVFNLPEKVIEEHGSVDMVFNNAGVALSSTVEESSDEDWEWGLGILLHGVINGTRAFLPHLKSRPEAAIVNTLSAGDKILMFETGHFSTLWYDIADKFKLEIDFVKGDWRTGVDPNIVESKLKEDIEKKIKAVCAVHNETSTGVTSRIGEIRKAMDNADHPALLFVDTISSLGSIDYRHEEWKVDVTVGGSQTVSYTHLTLPTTTSV